MGPETLPPHRHISSTPISNEAAADILATYLRNSEAHPHLHPDALITPMGVQFGSHGGPSGGVVLHNLRRVAAGLRGEYLEPEPSPEPEERVDQDGKGPSGKKKTFANEEAVVNNLEGEWQDKSDYEREEGQIEVEEVGDRDNFVTSGGDAPEVEVAEDGDGEAGVGQKRKNVTDKEARKRAKKARNQETKKKKNSERKQKAAEAE